MTDTKQVDRPIFFVGMPRSGTTILFEAFARHPALAWPTRFSDKWPNRPWMNILRPLTDNRLIGLAGHKQQYGTKRLGNRFRPLPSEAYGFWNTVAAAEFGRGYMTDGAPDRQTKIRVAEAVRRLAKWQFKPRFAAKLTGPPRIGFLSAIFPDAIFVHVVRDGRAVVHSLLRVDFWRSKGGLEAPFWRGGPALPYLAEWERADRDPGVLAALQWNQVVGLVRSEATVLPAGQFLEVKYEDFVARPLEEMRRLLGACGLEGSGEVERYLAASATLSNMNLKFRRDFSPEYVVRLSQHMRPCLGRYEYDEAGQACS